MLLDSVLLDNVNNVIIIHKGKALSIPVALLSEAFTKASLYAHGEHPRKMDKDQCERFLDNCTVLTNTIN